jgi:hypothetical protein
LGAGVDVAGHFSGILVEVRTRGLVGQYLKERMKGRDEGRHERKEGIKL